MFNMYQMDQPNKRQIFRDNQKELLEYYAHYDQISKIISQTQKTVQDVNLKVEKEVVGKKEDVTQFVERKIRMMFEDPEYLKVMSQLKKTAKQFEYIDEDANFDEHYVFTDMEDTPEDQQQEQIIVSVPTQLNKNATTYNRSSIFRKEDLKLTPNEGSMNDIEEKLKTAMERF